MAPNSFKQGLILDFLTTAKRLCSSTLYFDQEVSKLKNMLYRNGYPDFYFITILSAFQSKSDLISIDTYLNFVLLKIPFVGNSSFNFSNRMCQTLAKNV